MLFRSLWLKNIEDCELLNDDNPIVRVFDDRVIVYGTPWSGKTDCYKNKSLPVAGFIRLKQASDNKLTRLAPALSFTSLLPSCSNMIWDEKINDMVCNAISKIVSLVPVYLLECLPDKGAVLMSKTILK